MTRTIAALCVALTALTAHADPIEDALTGKVGDGTLTDSIAAITGHLVANPEDDRARLALGILRIVKTGEDAAQWLYRYGAGNPTRMAGGMVFPMLAAIPGNPDPELLRYENIDTFFRTWMADLAEADMILAQIRDDNVKLDIDLARLRLDLNGNGVASDHEMAGAAFSILFNRGFLEPEQVPSFVVAADRADAEWLRAYCHVLIALGEMHLAHDQRELFERVGQVVFPNIETPHGYLRGRAVFDPTMTGLDIADFIALVHLIRFPVDEPARMRSAREHWLRAIGHSRAMWAFALAETDDDREWLPNPNQQAAMSAAVITEESVELWHDLLDDTEAALNGQKLTRFWRGDGTKGINLRRVFEEPRAFDLILWIQGSAAGDYLEEGEFTRDGLWGDFERAFGHQPFRYIFYVN